MGSATPAMPIKMGLLALLLKGPAHGYELRKRFEDASGGVWPLNVGQVYDSLKRLDRDGFVARTDQAQTTTDNRGPERRAFRITATGRDEVHRWLGEALEPNTIARDELAVRILIAHATDADLVALLQQERQSFMSRMQTLVRRKQGALDRGATAEVLLIDLLQLRLRADSEWLDLVEQRLSTPASTTPGAPN